MKEHIAGSDFDRDPYAGKGVPVATGTSEGMEIWASLSVQAFGIEDSGGI